MSSILAIMLAVLGLAAIFFPDWIYKWGFLAGLGMIFFVAVVSFLLRKVSQK